MSDDDVTTTQPGPTQFPESCDSWLTNERRRDDVASGNAAVLGAVRSVERRVRSLAGDIARLRKAVIKRRVPRPHQVAHAVAIQQHRMYIISYLIIIIIIPRTIFIVLSIRRQPYARVHFGSSGQHTYHVLL